MRYLFYISLVAVLLPLHVKAGSLENALETSASGISAQGERIRIATENIANADTTGTAPGAAPYRRKMIFFEEVKNQKKNSNLVRVKKIDYDRSEPKLVYEPNHPAANADGYVAYPNIDPSLESMNLRDAQRSYEANISAIENTKQMMNATVDLIRQ